MIVAARAGGVASTLAAVGFARPDLRGVPEGLPALLAISVFDITANGLFALSSTLGLLPVVAGAARCTRHSPSSSPTWCSASA